MRRVLRDAGPTWFTPVMGTGVLACGAEVLPVGGAVLDPIATMLWAVAALLLMGVSLAGLAAWQRPHRSLRAEVMNPEVAPFLAAPPIAVLTVAAGALLAGAPLLGERASVWLAAVLWTLGTASGLAVAVVVPVVKFTRHSLRAEDWLATWILPTVPPLVSASTGALLLAHLPAGQAQLTMLLAGWAMLGATLVATMATLSILWARMAFHQVGAAAATPTVWLVLGPLGQAVTAALLLGEAGVGVLPAPYGAGLRDVGLAVALPIWGFTLLWLMIAATITLDVARRHLPFTLTWWSFVYPVGTCVVGTSLLADVTRAVAVSAIAVGLFALLVSAWVVSGVRTTRAARARLVALEYSAA
ncbi:MAG: C4-dicarboxylate ABC transporter [Solirubrobacteraceae bacterium]|nr:C4-dicarboxylate ABC transporter [Solirubrobacteraceae bacterium]